MPDGDGGKGEEPRLQSQNDQELSASAGPRQLNLKMTSENQTVDHTNKSVLQRRVPHPSHLTRPMRRVQLTRTRPPRIGIWLKGKKAMLCAQSRRTLTRCGMHFRSTQMGQCNGFRSRLWQWVRTFTVKLVKTR